MDAKLVREWKARYEAVNAILLEEARRKTPLERFAALNAHLIRLQQMGKLSEHERDNAEHMRWSQVQEMYIERKSRSD